eukprot:1143868-Pelagomonas_calceolata.AAC.4
MQFQPRWNKKKNYAGSESALHINQGKEDTQGQGTMYPLHQEKKELMGITRFTSSTPCLILVMRVEKSLLESPSGAIEFLGIVGRMGMRLQSKLEGCISIKTKLFKRLQTLKCEAPGVLMTTPTPNRWIAVLLIGGLELISGPGVFAVFDFHKVDVPLFWRELTRVTNLGSRWSGCGWRRVLTVPPAPPSASQWIPGIVPRHSFH